MGKHIELRGARRLTSQKAAYHRPAWAPDGRLALELDGRAPAIFIVDGKGRLEGRLCEGGEAAWSPDGQRVAFTRVGRDGRREIWVCDAASPEAAHRLAGGDGAVWEHPAWSPGGDYVACASDFGNPGGLRHIWLLDAVHGDRRRVTGDPQRSDGHPAFCLDGQALAFDGDDRADDAREMDIYVLDLRSGALDRLSDGATPTRRPVFADRRWLVAERRAETGPHLCVLDRAKKRTYPVAGAGGEREPAVRLDKKGGVLVAYARREEKSQRDAIWVAELRGIKVVSEELARAADAADVEPPPLPVLPPLPPGAPSPADAPEARLHLDLYGDEDVSRDAGFAGGNSDNSDNPDNADNIDNTDNADTTDEAEADWESGGGSEPDA